MIGLFTDFGSADLYVGQIHAALLTVRSDIRWLDLLHDAPAGQIEASAHLLGALLQNVRCNVVMAVVDPGVGSARRPVAVHADGCWLVGPDNGLLSVAVTRAAEASHWIIEWRPDRLSTTFHGRDLFAPVAAMLDTCSAPPDWLRPIDELAVKLAAEDLAQVIYIDHYGNAMTGLRSESVVEDDGLLVGDTVLKHAFTFSAVMPETAFWYVNSIGLVEIAVNRGSAAVQLGLQVGTPVQWVKKNAASA